MSRLVELNPLDKALRKLFSKVVYQKRRIILYTSNQKINL